MTEIMKPGKKKQDDVWLAYETLLSGAPSPLDSILKHLVFLNIYLFVQGELDRKTFSKQLVSSGVNPLDVSFFIEEAEKQKDVLKKNVLPIRYVSQ